VNDEEKTLQAKAWLEAHGYTVLKTKTYHGLHEKIRKAEAHEHWAKERMESVEAWARREIFSWSRHLQNRLTFVYGVAKAKGATDEDLRQSCPVHHVYESTCKSCVVFKLIADGLREVDAHCENHEEYNVSCRKCVETKIAIKGGSACGHTAEEGCTGHGDF